MLKMNVMAIVVVMLLVGSAQGAYLLIEDGASVDDWGNYSGAGLTISSDAGEGQPVSAMKMTIEATAIVDVIAYWLPVDDSTTDWTMYDTLTMDVKTDKDVSPHGHNWFAGARIRNAGTFYGPYEVVNTDYLDGGWHTWTFDISIQPRNDVRAFELSVYATNLEPRPYSVWFDNVELTPEPATMSLLLIGLPFVLRRRR